MRGAVIRAAMQRGHTVVGQVRRDTALFELPPPRAPGRRGRPRQYGTKLDATAVAQLPVSQHRIGGYAGRMARLRHLVCRPRFLRGVTVQAVWCELQKGGGGWAKQRLLLSTDLTLSAVEVVEAYLTSARSKYRCAVLLRAAKTWFVASLACTSSKCV